MKMLKNTISAYKYGLLLPLALAFAAALTGCAGTTVIESTDSPDVHLTIHGNPLTTTIVSDKPNIHPKTSQPYEAGVTYIADDWSDDYIVDWFDDQTFTATADVQETTPIKTQPTPKLPTLETSARQTQDVSTQQAPQTQELSTQQEAQPASTAYGWYGDGSAASFNIGTADELAEFADIVNGTTGGDPAKSDFSGKLVNLIRPLDLKNEPMMSIGSADYPFLGHFNGGWHLISGLNIDNGDFDFQGLFGYIGPGGAVTNLGVSGSVSGRNFVGGVAGSNDGTILNCGFTGKVSGGGSVGGVAGRNGGSISVCYNSGDVSGVTGGIGGLAGENIGVVSNCYNTGKVSGVQNEHGNSAGGVAGKNGGTLSACYNIGSVSASGGRYGRGGAGGIAGISGGDGANVQNSVSLGLSASLTGKSGSAGRVAGAFTGGTIMHNKARSDMRIGVKDSEFVPVANIGAFQINGASVAPNTPLADVFSGWDVTVWDIPFGAALSAGGGLPVLRDAP